MLRDRLNESLKDAIRAKDQRAVGTIRLILAALKDRDIGARERGQALADADILDMLQSMIKQRADAVVLYEQGCRMDLAEQERAEIDVIRRFLPHQMNAAEIDSAVESVIGELAAERARVIGLKDMGRIMTTLRERYAGRMDFGLASRRARARLA